MNNSKENGVLKGQQKHGFLEKVNTYHNEHLDEYKDFISKQDSLDSTIIEFLCSLMSPNRDSRVFMGQLLYIIRFNSVLSKMNRIISWLDKHLKLRLKALPLLNPVNNERTQSILIENLSKMAEEGNDTAYHIAYSIFIDSCMMSFISNVTLSIKNKPHSSDIDNLMTSCVKEAAERDITNGNRKRKEWILSVQSGDVFIRGNESREDTIDFIRNLHDAKGRPAEVGKKDLIDILQGSDSQKGITVALIRAFKNKYNKPKYMACLYYILLNKGGYNNCKPLIEDVPYTTFHNAVCKYLKISDNELYPRQIYGKLLSSMKLHGNVDKRCKPYMEVIKEQLPSFYEIKR